MMRMSSSLMILAVVAVTVSALSVVSDDWRPRETRGTGRSRDRGNKGVKLYGELGHYMALGHKRDVLRFRRFVILPSFCEKFIMKGNKYDLSRNPRTCG